MRQHGNVARAQLLALGMSRHAITHRAQSGRLHRVHQGVYAVGRPPKTALERAAGAVLACGDGAVLSHFSAMALWGLIRQWPTRFEVTVPGQRQASGITVHRSSSFERRDVRRHHGIRVTSPARTLLDCAPDMSDRPLTRAVNDALLSGHLRHRQLAELLARCPNHRGKARLIPFTEIPDAPTRSEFEDAFLAFCTRWRLPRPHVNAKVAGYEVDALFEPERLIVELDGYKFHADRASFERDRNRDMDTLAAGYATVRITWQRMTARPRAEAERLHAILRARR